MSLFGGATGGIQNADATRLREKIEERLGEHPVMKVQNLEYAMNRYFRNKVNRDELPTPAFVEYLIKHYHTDGDEVTTNAAALSGATLSSVSAWQASTRATAGPVKIDHLPQRGTIPEPMRPAPPSEPSFLERMGQSYASAMSPLKEVERPPAWMEVPSRTSTDAHSFPQPTHPASSPSHSGAELIPQPVRQVTAESMSQPVRQGAVDMQQLRQGAAESMPQSLKQRSVPASPVLSKSPASSPSAPPSLLDEMKSFVSAAQNRREEREGFTRLLPTLIGGSSASPARSASESLAQTPPDFAAAQAAQGGKGFGIDAEMWGVREVCSWVLQNNWGVHLKQFRENEIDGYELVRLTPGDLRAELGISSIRVRKDILNGIASLRGYRCYSDMLEATQDSEADMQDLCESQRLALAELERLENTLERCHITHMSHT